LGFLEKVTTRPGEVTPEDVAPCRAAGLSDQAIEEALYVSFLFNVVDRLADAFDFPLPTQKHLKWTERILFNMGYGGASIPG
jgi:alkylhydroperoxidase family enzyme